MERRHRDAEGNVPEETTHLTFDHKNVSSIRQNLCDDHRALVKIHLHKDIRTIQQCTFLNCPSLKEVELSEGLQVIEQYAFRSCISLVRISVPSTVEEIGKDAFSKCDRLAEVEFPHEGSLRQIGRQAFQQCKSLFAVCLPRSLEHVGNFCFKSCENLCGVEIPASSPALVVGRWCFQDCKALVNTILPPRVEDDPILPRMFPKAPKTIDTIFHNNHYLSIECLRQRFVDCPVHQACYHASETTVEDLQDMTESISFSEDGDDDLTTDGLGLNPFHILATSAILRKDLLSVLLDTYPLTVLEEQDRFGKTMMDYLLSNPSCTAINLIQMVLAKTVLDPMSGWILESCRQELSETVMDTESWGGVDQDTRCRRLQEVQNKFEWYQRMEQTTLLELSLWKMSLAASSRPVEGVVSIIDRSVARMTCGAGVLIPNVTSFLFRQHHEDDVDA